MSSILRAKPGNSVGTSVGVERVLFSYLVRVVYVSKWGQTRTHDMLVDTLVGEMETTFSMSDPNSEGGTLHTLLNQTKVWLVSFTLTSCHRLLAPTINQYLP